MKTKHTPGPWNADWATGLRNGSQQVIEWFVRSDGDDVSIAADIVNPANGLPSESNARLIAAAPELLEALQELVSWQTTAPQKYVDAAKAAIAKAIGHEF